MPESIFSNEVKVKKTKKRKPKRKMTKEENDQALVDKIVTEADMSKLEALVLEAINEKEERTF